MSPRILRVDDEGDEGSGVTEGEEKKKWMRPPSSYGSMKSESENEIDEEEDQNKEDIAVVLPGSTAQDGMGYCVLVRFFFFV